MTFEEFMKLSVGDGVIMDGHVGTVTDLMTSRASLAMRQLEITFFNDRTKRLEKWYPVIYLDFFLFLHNRSVLSRLQIWDPFKQEEFL